MNSSSFSPATTVGEIVAAHPALARVFEKVGIDYCCGGKATLASACAARRLDAPLFAAMLEAVAVAEAQAVVDAAAMSLVALADHIEATHHAYLREDLPVLVEQAERVAAKHGGRDPRFQAVAEVVRELAVELLQHMAKEENVLFPLVRQMERTGRKGDLVALSYPIAQMEHEHDSAGGALARLRELTDGFAIPADACNTHRALLAGLARLEADLHQHVHKENNVLFPRALALEAKLTV